MSVWRDAAWGALWRAFFLGLVLVVAWLLTGCATSSVTGRPSPPGWWGPPPNHSVEGET